MSIPSVPEYIKKYNLPDRLKELRERTGLNKTDFSRELGITFALYSRMESGSQGITLPVLMAFHKVLKNHDVHVSVEFIISGEENPVLDDLVKKNQKLTEDNRHLLNIVNSKYDH